MPKNRNIHRVILYLSCAVFAVFAVFVSVAVAQNHEGPKKTILVYGDSLSWGWVSTAPLFPSTRYPRHERWPGILQDVLGDGFYVVTEALLGRTTNIDDPAVPGLLNGADYLPIALLSHEPLDLVIIMLGTNDLKNSLNRNPEEIGEGIAVLIDQAQKGSGLPWTEFKRPHILIISPPKLGEKLHPDARDLVEQMFKDTAAKQAALSRIYARIAKEKDVYFLDADAIIDADGIGIDGIHLSKKGHQDLANAISGQVRKILP